MRLARFAIFLSLLLSPALAANGQHGNSVADIKAVMQKSADDWNRGDLDAFARCYANSPGILLVGRELSRGYDNMLKVYRVNYGTKEKMGTLTFPELEVQPLDTKFATVTGHFHLERTAAGGGNADGFYLLVFEKTPAGWKIIRDDSTTLPQSAGQ